MFKKILLLITVLLPMSAMAQKFGIVNIQEIMNVMPEVAAAEAQLKSSSDQYSTELQKIQDEVQKLFNEYQTIAEDPNTPQSIKERRQAEINEKAQKIEQFRVQAQQDISNQQQQLMAPIQAKLFDAVKAVGQEGGYTMIMPKDEGFLLYTGSDVTDITANVKAKLGL